MGRRQYLFAVVCIGVLFVALACTDAETSPDLPEATAIGPDAASCPDADGSAGVAFRHAHSHANADGDGNIGLGSRR